MNWRRTAKLTAGDMLFIGGVLVGLGIAAVVFVAFALWVAKTVLGG